jgi:hypothetical protein
VTGVSLGTVLITVTSGAGGVGPGPCSFFSAWTDKGDREKIKATRKNNANLDSRKKFMYDPLFSFSIMKSNKYITTAAYILY